MLPRLSILLLTLTLPLALPTSASALPTTVSVSALLSQGSFGTITSPIAGVASYTFDPAQTPTRLNAGGLGYQITSWTITVGPDTVGSTGGQLTIRPSISGLEQTVRFATSPDGYLGGMIGGARVGSLSVELVGPRTPGAPADSGYYQGASGSMLVAGSSGNYIGGKLTPGAPASLTLNPIPEPSALGLFAAGLLVLGLAMRRKERRA